MSTTTSKRGKKAILIEMPPDVYDTLKATAKQEQRSMSAQIRYWITASKGSTRRMGA